jgi:hypothetical protein
MEITKIEKEEGRYSGTYLVTLTPNLIERFFGIKERVEKYKDTDSTYLSGGGNIYVNQEGYKTRNGSYIGESIDRWRRKF